MHKSILVVEDDKRINDLVKDYLEADGYKVTSAFDGTEGLEKFTGSTYDLIILDIMMPGLDGWSLCRRIRKNSDTLIILLTARSDEDDKLMGFELGADEYVTKPFSPKVLVARINALLKRVHPAESDYTFRDERLTIDHKSMVALLDNTPIQLTSKEFNLLSLLTKEPGRVYTRDTLLSQIWGYDYFGDGRVIDTNIKTLRKKLRDYSDCIVTVIGSGYKYSIGDRLK